MPTGSVQRPPLHPESEPAPTGTVFDISRGCFEDGPGLRTVVFLKGCNLNCPWCHNLEGKSFEPELAFDRTRCIECGGCEQVCPRRWPRPSTDPQGWRRGCTACGRCAEICPSEARRLLGRPMGVETLVRDIMSDKDFFDGTGGGVTFSGGEPLAQPEFLFACARALREQGVHAAVETSGYWPDRLQTELERNFDLILFDLKHVDLEQCRRALVVSSSNALENLRGLLATELDLELRITLVPGFNDSAEDLERISDWLEQCDRLPTLRLQPFHRMAAAKQDLLQRTYPYATCAPSSRRQLSEAAALFADRGHTIETV